MRSCECTGRLIEIMDVGTRRQCVRVKSVVDLDVKLFLLTVNHQLTSRSKAIDITKTGMPQLSTCLQG